MPPEDPAVAAILETKPATPAECAIAAKTLADLGHPDLAKRFLEESARRQAERPAIGRPGRAVRDAACFSTWQASRRCGPRPANWPTRWWPRPRRRRSDAQRIAGLIDAASRPFGGQADAGAGRFAGSRKRRPSARCWRCWPIRPARPKTANVRTVLAAMGRSAREPLVAVLQGADPKLMVQAILVLAEMGNPKAAIDLVGPCVSEKSDAEVRAAAAAALRATHGARAHSAAIAVAVAQRARECISIARQPIENVVDGQWSCGSGTASSGN